MGFVKTILYFTAPPKFCSYFLFFRQILIKFGTSVHFEFRLNRRTVNAMRISVIFFPLFKVKIRVKDLHNMLVSITRFRENWSS